eukprot:7909741-Prorocentrum_lima.AAC.1
MCKKQTLRQRVPLEEPMKGRHVHRDTLLRTTMVRGRHSEHIKKKVLILDVPRASTRKYDAI